MSIKYLKKEKFRNYNQLSFRLLKLFAYSQRMLGSSSEHISLRKVLIYLNVAYGIIYEDKLNCKRQRKSKDKEKLHSDALIRHASRLIDHT